MADRTIILEIRDTDFDPNYALSDTSKFRIREAARGVLLRNDKLALINVSNLKFHKLPGGGVEQGETLQEAFQREILEEVGCNCEITGNLGKVVEYRDKFKLKQISYIFVASVIGDIGPTKLEQDEISDGFILEWVSIDQALKLLNADKPVDYEGKFIVRRDLNVLQTYQNFHNRF